MEAYFPWIIQAVSGAVGGGALGAFVKNKSMGAVANLIAGAVGGVAAAQGLDAAGLLGQLTGALGGNALVSDGVAGLVGGGVLQLIANQIIGKKTAAE
ncbi:MAG: hypothetical protein AB7M12_03925 [Hyphomonadaceae bacterium]